MHESGEMYLETILVLGKKKPTVRAVDVADDLGYSKPSVSRGLARLKADGCIIVDADGRIALTEKGRQIAEKIYERHVVLSRTLMALGVDEETALSDACKMEHDLSDSSFEAIKKHFKYESKKRPNGSLFSFFNMIHALTYNCAHMVVGKGVVHRLALAAAFYEPVVF